MSKHSNAIHIATKFAPAIFPMMFAAMVTVIFCRPTIAQDGNDFFEKRIRPVLVERCYECHNSADSDDGGLALDHRKGLLDGGDSGPAIVPGKPDESLLLKAIRHDDDDLRMPQDNPKLSREAIADFARWIKMGAPDPRDKPPSAAVLAKEISWESIREKRKKWWSFQPVSDPKVPAAANPEWSKHPVDQFILQKLSAAKLSPSKQADRRTLIRRLSFALTGLPPTQRQIVLFLRDKSPNAYEKLVDRMLYGSPHFGERWARHWMDWFRYAESHGSEGDPNIPNAWRYRDYLIRALNLDVPYDQLVREHIAGDLLEKPRINEEFKFNESKIGLGHYRFVEHGYGPTDALDEQVRFTENQIDVITKAFLGLTVSCARCHDHKFDAISQNDFYALYGIMTNCRAAMVTIDTQEKLDTNKKELSELKKKIKSEISTAWLNSIIYFDRELAKIPKPSPESVRKDKKAQANLSPIQRAIDRALNDPFDPLHVLAKSAGADDDTRVKIWNEVKAKLTESRQRIKKRNETRYKLNWDFSSEGKRNNQSQWTRHGNGLDQKSSAAGEFAISLEGETIIGKIYPAGIYTHLLSTRHNGIFSSPNFDFNTDELWVHVVGGKAARVRYVVQNYPRVSGPVYKSHNLNSKADRWVKWDMRYWKGDRGHIELATSADIPVEAGNSARSWFGISQVIAIDANQPKPTKEIADFISPLFDVDDEAPDSGRGLRKRYSNAIKKCVRAWRSGEMTDAQANFLNRFIDLNLLPNKTSNFTRTVGLINSYRELENQIPIPTRTPGIIEAESKDHPLFIRGNHKKPGKIVPRRYLEAFDETPYQTRQSGRLELANSITDPNNPLASRVIVNRIWHHLFGQGIVKTTDNFGRLGAKPTHPELLDYLAKQFMADNQSIKKLIRLIVTSETFKQNSVTDESAKTTDPNNELLSYMLVRRLEAEAIRDALLRASGKLDSTLFGPPIGNNDPRRSIYVRVRRNSLHPFLNVFDAPAPYSTKGKRDVTNVPAQSLAMMNDPFVQDLSRKLVDRMFNDYDLNTNVDRIGYLYERTLARKPEAGELAKAIKFIEKTRLAQQDQIEKTQRLAREIDRQKLFIDTLFQPVREKILKDRKSNGKKTTGPNPYARWEFDKDFNDSIGKLHGKPIGKARIVNRQLILDGNSFVMTAPLEKDITAKTLEAWITLNNLDQRGGGAITLQTTNGITFDSIVFAERQKRRWMSGSNSFARTKDVGGSEENYKVNTNPVHVAIVYAADGTISIYRNGEPYGKPYKSSGPAKFSAGSSQLLFGLRHGTPANRTTHLSGAIHSARLYDRALSAEEVKASANGDPNFISRSEIVKSMNEADRKNLQQTELYLAGLQKKLREFEVDGQLPSEDRPWHELAKAIFSMKEFIYIR